MVTRGKKEAVNQKRVKKPLRGARGREIFKNEKNPFFREKKDFIFFRVFGFLLHLLGLNSHFWEKTATRFSKLQLTVRFLWIFYEFVRFNKKQHVFFSVFGILHHILNLNSHFAHISHKNATFRTKFGYTED
jgi:hypothetical protein